MKKNKFLSIVTAMATGVCMMSGTFFTAYACSNCNPPTNEVHGMGDLPDYYTLDELFAMSDEEFFELPNAKDFYDDIDRDAKRHIIVSEIEDFGGISGMLDIALSEEDENVKYTANITEMQIEELLGDAVKYKIDSPISLNWNYLEENFLYYGNRLEVIFPDYALYSQTYNITTKEITEFAKCWYCVNQVISINYYEFGATLDIPPADEEIITGDVNLDRKVNATDVDYMEKGLSGELALTDAQKKIADVNGDGKFDTLDVEKLKSEVVSTTEPTIQTATVPANVEASKYGDVNGDSEINVSDVVVINMFLLNADKYPLTDVQIANADCHNDGV